jgi:hypothetical protein
LNKNLNHGPCLSNEEYEKRIAELYRNQTPITNRKQEKRIRRKELDLTIDHRLGRNFPRNRREALWDIQQKVEKKRLRLIFKYLLRRFFANSLARDVQGLSGFIVSEYAKVLDEAELERFFGVQESRQPSLPVDLDRLSK